MFEIPATDAGLGDEFDALPHFHDSRAQESLALQDPPFGTFAPTPLQGFLLELGCRTILGRGRARWWTASVLERLRAGPLDVERLGLKLRLHYYGAHACDKKLLLHAKGCDREEIAFLAGENGGCFRFVDVGAHTGLYSLAVKSMHPGARVLAFEPHPTHCNRLSYNVRANALEDFTVHAVAVAAKNGVRPYYIERESLIGKGAFFDVPAVALYDALKAERLDGIDALKLDIEGYEDRVLFPFFNTAPRSMWPCMIIIEHTLRHWWKNDCLELCELLGYHQVFTGRFNTVLKRAASSPQD